MERTDTVAVFVDIENFINFCSQLGLPIDLANVLEKLQDEGKIIVRRSYGDIKKVMSALHQPQESDRVRRMLRENLFEHIDIPYGGNAFKNSADMQLAVDALTTAFTLPNITKFALISGDSDFVPLFRKLKEQSRGVIGISGSKDRTSVIYSRSCDSLYYVEDIHRISIPNLQDEPLRTADEVPAEKAIEVPIESTIEESIVETPAQVEETTPASVEVKQPEEPPKKMPVLKRIVIDSKPASAEAEPVPADAEPEPANETAPVVEIEKAPPAPVFDLQTIRDEYANLFVNAVRFLEQGGRTTTLQMVPPQLRQMQPDFDFERANFSSFVELAKFAQERGLIKLQHKGEDTFVSLPANGAGSKQQISTAQYRQYLMDKLKTPLPSFALRTKICDQTFLQIGYNSKDGGILLNYLSHDVADELADQNVNIPQSSIYKYLYSLYRARCFEIDTVESGDYNPKIVGFLSQKEQWDDRFVTLQIRAMSEQAKLKIYPAKLSQLFYESEARASYIKRLCLSASIKFEE